MNKEIYWIANDREREKKEAWFIGIDTEVTWFMGCRPILHNTLLIE